MNRQLTPFAAAQGLPAAQVLPAVLQDSGGTASAGGGPGLQVRGGKCAAGAEPGVRCHAQQQPPEPRVPAGAQPAGLGHTTVSIDF